jgi:alpha-N-acetylglucosamine transferase
LADACEGLKIVTVMAYDERSPMVSLCRLWTNRVRRHCPNAELVIIDGKTRSTEYPCDFNVSVKLWNLLRQEPPFIFLDADAIPVKPLDELWSMRGSRPLLAARQEPFSRSRKQGLNSGVMLVSDIEPFDYDEIAQIAVARKFQTDGYEQASLYEYCERHSIDWRALDQKWNWCAGIPPNDDVSIVHFWHPYRPWNNPACSFLLEQA